MKKLWILMAAALMLAGCAEEAPVFETVGPLAYRQEDLPAAGVIQVYLPSEADQTETEAQARIYQWENHEVRLDTMKSGDIQATMQALTGLAPERLTVMKQKKGDMTFYETVWSTTGDSGVLCGRALVADDGAYHYCMSLLSPESVNNSKLYDKMAESFRIQPEMPTK